MQLPLKLSLTSEGARLNLSGMTAKVNYSTFGMAVKSGRARKGATQAQVAEAAEVSIPFISAVENEREKSAAPGTIIKIAEFLDLDRERLLKVGAPRRVHQWRDAERKAVAERRKAVAS